MVLFLALFFVMASSIQTDAFNLPVECDEWSAILKQQCCSCEISAKIVCTHNCPIGFYEIGSFLIGNGKPSQCLLRLTSERLSLSSSQEEKASNKKAAVLCGPCSKSCRRCNGPTDQHCSECSSHSYKDVAEESVEFSGSESGEILAASLLLPDGNVVVYKKPSVTNLRKKREPDPEPPISGQLVGKSVRFNTTGGFSGYISWEIPEEGRIEYAKARKSRRRAVNIRRRRRRFVRTSKAPASSKPDTTTTTTTTTTTYPTVVSTIRTSGDVSSTVPAFEETTPTSSSTTTESTTALITEVSVPTISVTEAVPTTSKSSTVKATTTTTTTTRSSTDTTTTEVPTTTTVRTTLPETEPTTKQQTTTERTTTAAEDSSDFLRFSKSRERSKTWFRCVPMCPKGKYIVRETKCRECASSQCAGGRECFVINVHNVCVQSCQPGFVKHIGLMECLCPGPVVNQTCSQPVHTSYPEQLSDEYSSIIANLTIVIPILICFLTICIMLILLYWKRNKGGGGGGHSHKKGKGVLSSVFTTGFRFDKCYRKSEETDMRNKLDRSMSRELAKSNGIAEQKRDTTKEDTLGRIMWKFDEYPTRSLPQLPNCNVSDPAAVPQNKRWKIPIRWQVSTPPSIPKKKKTVNNGALSKVQAFLSKYTPDLYGNKEGSSIYKAPPPTPKICRLDDCQGDSNTADYGNRNYGARPQLIPVEVIQSWLHSSFHVDRSSGRTRPLNQGVQEESRRERNNAAENDVKLKRKCSRPISNCYESIDGSNDANEAIYESLSEDESVNDGANSDAYSYASVHSKVDARHHPSISRPVYANVDDSVLFDNSGVSC